MNQGLPSETFSNRTQWTVLLLLALVAMGRVLGNSWVQDEGPLLLENARIHGWSGLWSGFTLPWWPAPTTGGLYRPLAQALSTGQWMVGGGTVWVFKAGSVLCYLFAVAGVWALARRLLSPVPAWVAAALFAVHPVHTEAVGIAVNQGEAMVAGLAGFAAAWWIDLLDGRREGRWVVPRLLLLTALALGFKEHAVMIPFLLLAIGLLRRPAGTLRPLVPLFLLTALFWMARSVVLGGAQNAEAAHGLPEAFVPRLLTMLGVVPHWVRLLFWPAHLQADYAPLEIEPWGGWTPMHTLGVLLLLGAGALLAWSWKKRPVAAMALLWIGVALLPVSNIPLVTGIVLAERTLMLASVGGVLLLLALVPESAWSVPRFRTPLGAGIGALLILGVFRSADRMPAFHDPVAYVIALSNDAPRSWHTLDAVGTLELERGDRRSGEARLRAAMQIAPWHSRAYRTLARSYRLDGLCAPAIPLLERTVAIEPIDQYSRLSLVACYLDRGLYAGARRMADEGVAGPGRALQEAFRVAGVTADSAARARAPVGVVRLAPFPGDFTSIGAPPVPNR